MKNTQKINELTTKIIALTQELQQAILDEGDIFSTGLIDSAMKINKAQEIIKKVSQKINKENK